MHTAIGYLRVSTREQGRSGIGLAAQRQRIKTFGAREGATSTTEGPPFALAAVKSVRT